MKEVKSLPDDEDGDRNVLPPEEPPKEPLPNPKALAMILNYGTRTIQIGPILTFNQNNTDKSSFNFFSCYTLL